MINVCLDCKAVREYPSGKRLERCPRCDGTNLKFVSTTQSQNQILIDAIEGTLADNLLAARDKEESGRE